MELVVEGKGYEREMYERVKEYNEKESKNLKMSSNS